MKPTPKMQSIISRIAAHHRLDLSAPEAHLRLEQPEFMPLVIERIGENLLSVAHYYTQNGDAIADPDIVFFTGSETWIPYEISQGLGYRRMAELSDDGTAIVKIDFKGQSDLAQFCETWAQNIVEQGWLEAIPVGADAPLETANLQL